MRSPVIFRQRRSASASVSVGGDAEEHAEPAVDRADDVAVDRDARLAHALHHGTHARLVAPGRTRQLHSRPALIPDDLHIGPIPIHVFGICLALAFLAAGKIAALRVRAEGLGPRRRVARARLRRGRRHRRLAAAGSSSRASPTSSRIRSSTCSPARASSSTAGSSAAPRRSRGSSGARASRGSRAPTPSRPRSRSGRRSGASAASSRATATGAPDDAAVGDGVSARGRRLAVSARASACIPTPVYETILYTLTFAILWRMRREPHRDGTIFALVPRAHRRPSASSSSSCASSR